MNNVDFSGFEEQILNHLKEIEKKMLKHFNAKYAEIFGSLNKLESKLTTLNQNNDSLIETITNQKMCNNKLTEFESFKNKADDILISHEIRLKNNNNDISGLKEKYDKIISENISVPGYIGSSCQFRNLSQYLLYSINEINKIKNDKDDTRKEIKDLRIKFENLMKTMVNLNDSSFERCKDYINNKQKDINNIIEIKLKQYDEKNFDIKAHIIKNNSMNEEKINQINEKLIETKKLLIEILNEKIEEITKSINNIIEKYEINSKKIEKNSKDIQNINDNIEDINLNLKDIILNIKMANYNTTQGQEKMSINLNNSPKKSNQRILTRNSAIKGFSPEKNLSNNKKIKLQITTDNSLKNIYKKLGNIQSGKQDKERDSDKIIEKNENDTEIDFNSDIDNLTKNKIIFSDNNSFEKSKDSKINNLKNLKNNKSNSLNFFNYKSGQNFNNKKEQFYNIKKEQNYINKNLTNNLNKYINKETINAKSISPLKDEKIKSNEIINKFKPKKNIIQSQKILHSSIKNNIKSQEELENNNNMDKDNSINIKMNNKLKLNYELISKINENKVLDLYSFSTSPPNGKINLKFWTLTQNVPEKFIKNKTKFEMEKEKEKEFGTSYKLLQMENDGDKKKKIKVKSENNLQNDRNRLFKMKNKDKHGFSTERINPKNINTNYNLGINSNIIEIPPRFDINANKTFLENDFKEKNSNFDYLKLKKAFKELKINDQFYYYTNK